MGIRANVEIFGNPLAFPDHGVSQSQTLVLDGKILVEGYVPKLEDLIDLLKNPE